MDRAQPGAPHVLVTRPDELFEIVSSSSHELESEEPLLDLIRTIFSSKNNSAISFSGAMSLIRLKLTSNFSFDLISRQVLLTKHAAEVLLICGLDAF